MLLNSTFSNIKKKIYTVADLYSTPLLTRRKSSELQAMTWNAFHDVSISVSTGIHDFLTTHFLFNQASWRPYFRWGWLQRLSSCIKPTCDTETTKKLLWQDRAGRDSMRLLFMCHQTCVGKHIVSICFYAVLLLMIMMALTRPCRILWATSWLEKKLIREIRTD